MPDRGEHGRQWSGRGAWVALALLCSACGGESVTCTLLPDVTGLTVELSAEPVGPYTVEVLVPTSAHVSYVYRCDGTIACRGTRVFFPGLVTPYPTVRVTTTSGSRTTAATRKVEYADTYPNGPSCGPRSSTATITAPLPDG